MACIFHTSVHQTTMHLIFQSDEVVLAALLGRNIMFYRRVVMKMGKEEQVGYTLGVPKVRSNTEPIVDYFCVSFPVDVGGGGLVVMVGCLGVSLGLTHNDLQ